MNVVALRSIVCSFIARVEVPAALWGKQRAGSLTVADAHALTEEFELDWHAPPAHHQRFLVIGLAPSLLESAARSAAVHGLRAYDAVQLASAEAARAADPGCNTFACFDSSLRRVAATSGFALYPRD